MKTFIGVKIIQAEPQACPSDRYMSKAGDPGYKVEYEDGYVSWSPKDAFDAAYRQIDSIDRNRRGEKYKEIVWIRIS